MFQVSICLSGLGKYLETVVKTELGCKVRSVELNVLQRSASHLASKTDIDEAKQIGQASVTAALSGETGVMMIFKRISNTPYSIKIESVDINLIANKEQPFPKAWINENENGIKNEAIDYILPLIQGDINIQKKYGLPVHINL